MTDLQLPEQKAERCRVCNHFHECDCWCKCPAIPVEDFNASLGQQPDQPTAKHPNGIKTDEMVTHIAGYNCGLPNCTDQPRESTMDIEHRLGVFLWGKTLDGNALTTAKTIMPFITEELSSQRQRLEDKLLLLVDRYHGLHPSVLKSEIIKLLQAEEEKI